MIFNTKGYSSTYLAMGFANVRAGTWYMVPARTLANPIARYVLEYPSVLPSQAVYWNSSIYRQQRAHGPLEALLHVVPTKAVGFPIALEPECWCGFASSVVKLRSGLSSPRPSQHKRALEYLSRYGIRYCSGGYSSTNAGAGAGRGTPAGVAKRRDESRHGRPVLVPGLEYL